MANQRQRPDPSGFTAENEIDQVLGNANPNPNREGCPPADVLAGLARRERPVDDPAYDHLIKCSPCYREVRALQQAAGERRVGVGHSRAWWASIAAAVVILGIGAAWMFWSRSVDVVPGKSMPEQSRAPEVSARLDLRKYTVTRSEQKETRAEPIQVPRGRLSLTMLLPVGSEPGEYDVQILDSDLTSRASTSGRAEIRDFITTLHATIDLAELAPGPYQLAVRRQGEDWRLFPATIE